MFNQNVGVIDRIIRVVAGLGLLITGPLVVTGVLGGVLAAVGGILMLTGGIGTCPLYLPFKINTRTKPQ